MSHFPVGFMRWNVLYKAVKTWKCLNCLAQYTILHLVTFCVACPWDQTLGVWGMPEDAFTP